MASTEAQAANMAGVKGPVASPPQTIAIYVGDLNPDVTEQDLYSEFTKVSRGAFLGAGAALRAFTMFEDQMARYQWPVKIQVLILLGFGLG